MNDQSFELKLQGIFHRLQENLEGKEFYQMRYDRDRNVYLLVAAGEQAQLAHDFLVAVGEYAHKIRHTQDDKEAAKDDVLAALEAFASRLTL